MSYVNLYPLFAKSLSLLTSLEFEMPAEKTSVSAPALNALVVPRKIYKKIQVTNW